MKYIWKEVSPHTGKEIEEDAPTNSAGGGNVHGIGVGPYGEPGINPKKKKKRQKLQLFGIGDTNMFLVKKNEITGKLDVVGWPVTSVESFTDRTNALFSLDNTSQGIPELKEFNVKRGDIVILATDALAKWILEYYNLGQRPWSKILKNKNDIANFIDKLRYTNKIDDDDTTCIIIRI